jgi:hypothetical protein
MFDRVVSYSYHLLWEELNLRIPKPKLIHEKVILSKMYFKKILLVQYLKWFLKAKQSLIVCCFLLFFFSNNYEKTVTLKMWAVDVFYIGQVYMGYEVLNTELQTGRTVRQGGPYQGGPYVWTGRTVFWDRADRDSRRGGPRFNEIKIIKYWCFFAFVCVIIRRNVSVKLSIYKKSGTVFIYLEFKGDHQRNIPVKFRWNWLSSLWGVVF